MPAINKQFERRITPAVPTELPPATRASLAKLHARAWGISMGLMLGLGLFLATAWLVAKGGPDVGQHLRTLSVLLPGYSVSYGGAFVGFVYMFVAGYALGRLVGVLYNQFVRPA